MRSTGVNLRLALLEPFENEALEQLLYSEYRHQKTDKILVQHLRLPTVYERFRRQV